MIQLPCACCMPTMALVLVCVIWFIFKLFDFVIISLFPKWKTVRKVYSIISYLITGLVALIAISLGYISRNPDMKDFVFYKFAMMIANKPQPMDAIRCEHFSHISGRVLELGPGPGTNFQCWQNNSKITEWVGIEPNQYFHAEFEKVQHNLQLLFPISAKILKGENLDIDMNSFDVVIGTHVLCSVDSIPEVLRQITRALKPGGSYYFIEHVSSAEGSIMYYAQRLFEPFINIIGNGCQFKPTWEYLSNKTNLQGYDVSLEHFNAPMPLPMLIPHIKGVAVKR